MNSIQQIMAADHKRCDKIFIDIENLVIKTNWQSATTQLAKFIRAMDRHFEHEEKTLFPAFEHKTGGMAGPTMMMRHEHEKMRELMSGMKNALADKNTQRYLGLSETLLIFMQQHNVKEEQILYPMIDNDCGDQAEQLMRHFNTHNNSDAA